MTIFTSIDAIGPCTITYDPPLSAAQCQGRFRLRTGDDMFTEADGGKAGLYLVFDSNSGSADYNPRYFNRCRRLMAAQGLEVWATDIPEHPRALNRRPRRGE
jgi:hypothetical protein